MSEPSLAILEHKKEPFLKAFVRSGKVAPATRAVRISRDAVYDWIKADPVFRRQFQKAKRERFDSQTVILSQSFDLFLATVKPIVPADLFTRIVAATNLTLSKRKFKVDASSTVSITSRKKERFPSFEAHPEPANSGLNGGSRGPQGKNERPLT